MDNAKTTWYIWFQQLYPKFIKFIEQFSSIVFSILNTILNTFFILFIFGLVVLVEIPRVEMGIKLIDDNSYHATQAAIATVFSFLTLYSLTFYVRKLYDEEITTKYKFSLRVVLNYLKYLLGFSELEALPKSVYITSAATISKWTIIVLSVVGTMQQQIRQTGDLKWYEGLINVLLDSNLELMSTWILGLLFAYFLTTVSSALAYHIAYMADKALSDIEGYNKAWQKSQQQKSIIPMVKFAQQIGSRILKRFTYHEKDGVQYDSTNKTVKYYDGTSEQFIKDFDISNKQGQSDFVEFVRQQKEQTKE